MTQRHVSVEFTPHTTALEPLRPRPLDPLGRLFDRAGVVDTPNLADGADAYRFNASHADAEAAIAEWQAFVAEIRRS